MKLERKIIFSILIVILSFFASGCASPYLLLRKNPTLVLQPNEGAVLFSSKFINRDKPDQKNIFWVTTVTLQEVNQYKSYSEKRLLLVPLPKENYIKEDDLFLLSLKLPRGTYKITSLDGMFRTLFATQYFVAFNRIFDVIPGQINYAGRAEIEFFNFAGRQIHEVKVEDRFGEDEGRFMNSFPALQNRKIIKELIY